MSENTYNPGDLVWLKSGSPRMVIVSIEADQASVVWCHYDTGTMHSATVPFVALTKDLKA